MVLCERRQRNGGKGSGGEGDRAGYGVLGVAGGSGGLYPSAYRRSNDPLCYLVGIEIGIRGCTCCGVYVPCIYTHAR